MAILNRISLGRPCPNLLKKKKKVIFEQCWRYEGGI